MNARDRWPRNRTLDDDPARTKSRFMGNAAGASDYFARIQRYNTALYTPADTRPGMQPMPTIAPLSSSRIGAGWQQPRDPLEIAARYGTPDTFPMSNTMNAMDSFGTQRPGAGAAGPTGDELQSEGYVPGMPADYRPQPANDPRTSARLPTTSPPPAPRVNSIQRWTPPPASPINSTERYEAREAARGVSRKSADYPAARRFLRIDGSAPQSERNAPPAPVVFNKTESKGWGKPMNFTDLPPINYADLRKKYQP